MNIDTHNNHIAFISTDTKIGTPHEKTPLLRNGSEFTEISLIVSRLLTWDTNQNLGKAS